MKNYEQIVICMVSTLFDILNSLRTYLLLNRLNHQRLHQVPVPGSKSYPRSLHRQSYSLPPLGIRVACEVVSLRLSKGQVSMSLLFKDEAGRYHKEAQEVDGLHS